MLFIVVIETWGWVLALRKIDNQYLYNPELLIEFCFTAWWIQKALRNYMKVRTWLNIISIAFAIGYAIEISIKGVYLYASVTNAVMSFVFAVAAALYFYFLQRSDEYVDMAKSPVFWIMVGILVFYMGSTAVNFFFEILAKLNESHNLPIRGYILMLLNPLLYSCWIYAFKCKHQQTILSY